MRVRPVLVLAAALLAAPGGSTAQEPDFTVSVDAAAGGRAIVRVGDVLGEPDLEEAMRAGLPVRLRFRVELWKDEFFDELVGTERWTVVVYYEPLSSSFLVRSASPQRSTRSTSFAGVRAELARGYALSLRPSGAGRYYYTATLEVETLSLSDLEELENWLKGELQPAVSGQGSVGGAVSEGVRRLLIRMLALPERKFEARTGRFRVGS